MLSRIYTYLIISLFYNLSLLCISLIAVKAFKLRIEEIYLGFDKLFTRYIKDIKLKFGPTLFLSAGLKLREHENETIRERENNLLDSISLVVTVILFLVAWILTNFCLANPWHYLQYFFFIIDWGQLKNLLYNFNGFDLALGISELAVISSLSLTITKKFILRSKYSVILYLILAVIWIGLYTRLVYDFIFNL